MYRLYQEFVSNPLGHKILGEFLNIIDNHIFPRTLQDVVSLNKNEKVLR